ncbi:MAG TPA: hypothetical protein PL131_06950 [Methylotenera sp.]|nr:hypothetical protein [Methylotenera sp.]HPH05597.1 hypothetical protein [Methylotenera sp.]HPM99988.1 hypothetical protein [Methylotenera sp.]
MIYNLSSLTIALELFACMIVACEIGHWLGKRLKKEVGLAYQGQIDSVQSSLLGILALLIAFTFSIALQRFESRNDAVVDEANAIGTAFLRTQLLPKQAQPEIQQTMRQYVDLRARASQLALNNATERDPLLQQATMTQDKLWQQTMQLVPANATPVTYGLFIQSLNEMIDSFGRRTAVISRHVPEAVLGLLAIVFTMTSWVIGFNAGIAQPRVSKITYLKIFLVALLVYAILDLDHPRQGMIQVDQTPLLDLQRSIHNKTD